MEVSLRSERLARRHGKAHSRRDQLERMLEARRQAIEDHVQQKIRAFRDPAGTETSWPADDVPGDPAHEDLDFTLVQMQAQTLENIVAALARLRAGDDGICHDCEEAIPEKRLYALPFATRCVLCQERVEGAQRRERRMGRGQADSRRSPIAGTAA